MIERVDVNAFDELKFVFYSFEIFFLKHHFSYMSRFLFFILLIYWSLNSFVFSQDIKQQIIDNTKRDFDLFVFDSTYSNHLLSILGPGWGYNYDSLLNDIQKWKNNPYVVIDSIGSSLQGRGIWQVSISANSTNINKRRIWIHARTHPNEIQGWGVTNEIIKMLLGTSYLSEILRNNFIFNIIPMYNPDGVELGYPRENANKIDIESNWNNIKPEPEVIVLKNQLSKLMNSSLPIQIALNMHSDYRCKRFFVFHHANGSSLDYEVKEKNFISKVRNYFLSGIEDWNYSISWTSSTGLQYPEGWFWTNYKEKVIALTFEDMNCSSAGDYDKTANAMLRGIIDYLSIPYLTVGKGIKTIDNFALEQNYPNPFNSETRINITIPKHSNLQIKVFNSIGQEIYLIYSGYLEKGSYTFSFNSRNLSSGVYQYRMIADNNVFSRRMIILK